MKQIFYTTAVALTTVIVAASCKDNARLESQSVQTVPVSTTEFQEFQNWKQQQLETQKQNTASYTTAPAPVKEKVVYRTKYVEPARPARSAAASAPVAQKKKGWSKAAKGTVIGAAAGAGAGAIINKKNRALGAVIGGVVGGGVGYGIGRSQDKKDGRY
jgi:hypothetical protein